MTISQKKQQHPLCNRVHPSKNNQEQYSDHPKNLKNHNVNRKQIGFMKSTGYL